MKAKPPQIGDLVTCSWFDAHADAKAELNDDEINRMQSYRFSSFGILVRDDREKQIVDPLVAIAAEVGEDGRYRGVTFIPAGMVYDVRRAGKGRKTAINPQNVSYPNRKVTTHDIPNNESSAQE